MAQILKTLGVDSSALIVTAESEENVVKSARNLPRIGITSAGLLNVLDILSHKVLLMTVPAMRKAEELWGEGATKRGKDASIRSVAATAGN